MTLSKLAQLANVSVSVVSKAFSGRSDISDAMREHVFQVARENGCFQQFYHVPYDKPVIAVIIPEIIHVPFQYVNVLNKVITDDLGDDDRDYRLIVGHVIELLKAPVLPRYPKNVLSHGIADITPSRKRLGDYRNRYVCQLCQFAECHVIPPFPRISDFIIS